MYVPDTTEKVSRSPQKTCTGHHRKHVQDTTNDMYRTPQKTCTGHRRRHVPDTTENVSRFLQKACTGHHNRHVPDTTENMYRTPQKTCTGHHRRHTCTGHHRRQATLQMYRAVYLVISWILPSRRPLSVTSGRTDVPDTNEGMYRTPTRACTGHCTDPLALAEL